MGASGLNQRGNFSKHNVEHKKITKAVKQQLKHLKHEKLRQETDEINENANCRQVKQPYKNMKDGTTKFKTIPEKQFCDPNKLKEHFKAPFNICSEVVDPTELENVPSFIRHFRILTIPNRTTNRTAARLKLDSGEVQQMRYK